jgi:hypothetical protein
MRVVPQLETYSRLVSLVQTPAGKVAAAAAFGLLLLVNGQPLALEISAVVAVLSFAPEHRRVIVSAATLGWLLFHPSWIPMALIRKVAADEYLDAGFGVQLAVGAAVCTVLWAIGAWFATVRKRPNNLLARRPVFVLVLSYLCLLAMAGALPLHGAARMALWIAVAVIGPYLWFFAYALTDATSKNPDSYPIQFGTFFPFWVGSRMSFTPIGKGAAFLRKVEVHTGKELALLQLRAIKLLVWMVVLNVAFFGVHALVYGQLSPLATDFCRLHGIHVPNLGAPTLEAAIDQTAAGTPVALHMRWIAVLAQFMDGLLGMSISGNLVVACVRMSGFNILRNTYRPLNSPTIAEFWNRFYFYFKELLVEFFFFPTYIRYFKQHRRLRLAAATFAAATLGNLIYHFCRDIQYVFDLGLWRALAGLQVYAFYAVVLGAAIAISQLRGKRPPLGSLAFHRRVISSAGVIGFYCLLGVFNYEGRSHSLRTHLAFFWSLVPNGTGW